MNDLVSFRLIIQNILWLAFDRVGKTVVGFFVTFLLARYLGASDFGILVLITVYYGLSSTITGFGLKSILVNDFSKKEVDDNIIASTALAISLSMGVVVYLVIVLYSFFSDEKSDVLKYLMIVGFSLVVRMNDVFVAWSESNLNAKKIVNVGMVTYFLVVILKVVGVYAGMSLIYFVYITLIDFLILSVSLFVFCRNGLELKVENVKVDLAKDMMLRGLPLLLMGATVALYMKTDQIMLGVLLNEKAVGIYSASMKFTEVFYMLPSILVATFTPLMIRMLSNKEQGSEAKYWDFVERLMRFLVFLGLVVVLLLISFSNFIESSILGVGYEGASDVIKLQAWLLIFVCIGGVLDHWYIHEGLQYISFLRILIGAVINIVLNYIFIPDFGASGAVFSTLVAYCFASFLVDFLMVRTRIIFWLKCRSLIGAFFIFFVYKDIRYFIKNYGALERI